MIEFASFKTQLAASAPRLFELIDGFKQSKVLVVGDLTLDEFLTGEVERISREAPVLIIRHETTRQTPGGGANAVYNFAKLGAEVKVAGFLSKDPQGQVLRTMFEEVGIDTSSIVIDPDRPTVTKSRIAGHARQSVTQQIVRIDRKSDELPDRDKQLELAAQVQQHLGQVDAVVCSDYGDGVFTPPVIEAVLSHDRTIVDTQKNLERYHGARVFTPNLPEAERAVGYGIKSFEDLLRAGRDLLALTQGEEILITRGEQGMSLFGRDGKVEHIPAFNRTDVFDVTGAGDTVVAALTLSLCLGSSYWEAAVLGNLAASIVVRQFGTATTSQDEMKEALQGLLEVEA
ncbi:MULTISPECIES: PfkB family carbohydrate kinase [unclassified Moorena]|uniref:bifunctional heptose 7-phosphate kinase/heptose 1-phosphate adenyltransferase n=1 Tax=unclassified Moorena TaxID=2683338 RepID=UPI0013BA662B|nr:MULTISPECIES: PfkB family carbohydrate kinase [unclassified Moorena]NER90896.1 D-glycero-beta-D-manno-heptose-7-phosphate kinase [Moorena sp. SIO3A2]NES45836.1 D-glycero-beta-D-manno-heptose-7-phosphate kinase [Moorena sp. SIO2C4]